MECKKCKKECLSSELKNGFCNECIEKYGSYSCTCLKIKYLNEYGQNTFFTLCTQKMLYWNLNKCMPLLNPAVYNILIILCFVAILVYPNYICRYLNVHCPLLVGKGVKQNKNI